MADLAAIDSAANARFSKALELATPVAPGIVLKVAFNNLKRWIPDPETSYLRCYYKTAGEARQSGGDLSVYAQPLTLFADILVVLETGSDILRRVREAIKPAFQTQPAWLPLGDGLLFEEGSEPGNPREDGDHFVAVAGFPALWREIRAAA